MSTPPLMKLPSKGWSDPSLELSKPGAIQFKPSSTDKWTSQLTDEFMTASLTSMREVLNSGVLPTMTKKDYEKLALAVRKMRSGMVDLNHLPQTTVDTVTEIIIAQLGMVLASENSKFDSFVFEAMCKGSKKP